MLDNNALLDKVLEDPTSNSLYKLSESEEEGASIAYDVKGRNSKRPKRANHGARPCSSVMRKLKKRN